MPHVNLWYLSQREQWNRFIFGLIMYFHFLNNSNIFYFNICLSCFTQLGYKLFQNQYIYLVICILSPFCTVDEKQSQNKVTWDLMEEDEVLLEDLICEGKETAK